MVLNNLWADTNTDLFNGNKATTSPTTLVQNGSKQDSLGKGGPEMTEMVQGLPVTYPVLGEPKIEETSLTTLIQEFQ